eukprot:Skav221641  [mRNA]  locus=scaffold1174:60625:61164:+ [translate_table: standard]
MRDDSGEQIGATGFFARGMFSAVNWDQVARLQHLTAYESAKASGQLLFYIQAVDLVHQPEFAFDGAVLKEILAVTNMASKTGNLISFLPLHVGMKVKVTKKLLPPEVVQECPGEVISFHFHPNERFGVPGHAAGQDMPDAMHDCWSTGHVRLDYLPAAIAVRLEVRHCVTVFRLKDIAG